MRLSARTLDRLAPDADRFAYDRESQATGIVHLGIGAFHRAHQAWYTDRAMDAGDRGWMISGVSLRSPAVAGQLNPQDGLYSMIERSSGGARARVIGSVREVLVASADRLRLKSALSAPTTHIVSITVTEKGYCRAADGSLDALAADAGSFYAHLATAFQERRDRGLPGMTLLSCDNLAQNGVQLQRLMSEYLERLAPDLRRWFEAECACPSSMVDRIVPATTDADRATAASLLGLDDAAAVMTEPFSQWVIEDRFAGPRPRWDIAGAELVADVVPYETAKLRMLNGAHSALAYLGLERGHTFVHEAITDPELRRLVERLLRDEAATSFTPAPGQDVIKYAGALLARFGNTALNHRLSQIAMDGSQKIPQRWLQTLAAHAASGVQCPAILAALGAWLRYVRGDRFDVDDPLASELQRAWAGRDLAGTAHALFAPGGRLGGVWKPKAEDLALMAAALPKGA